MQSNSFIRNLSAGITKRTKEIIENPESKANLNWFKIKFLKHASADKLRTYNYKGKLLYYTKPTELLHGLREIFVDEIYSVNLPSRPFIIDCGANIGMSVIYLKERFPDAEIVAFEPDEKNFELLSKNVASFQLNHVTIRQEAVWVEDTELTFKSDGTMGSKIDVVGTGNYAKVKASRLKDFLNTKIDFLKIDIEGAEYSVLKDIESSLDNVENMFLEYHGNFDQNNELIEIFSILHNRGFAFYIKEAANVYTKPFAEMGRDAKRDYDIQLNIFCMRNKKA
jgi:FkbM family methyltransferase